MKNLPLRIILGFALFASVGIFLVQGYWFRQAFQAKQKEFEFQIFSGLKEVALDLADYKGIMLPSYHPVEQLSNNYYAVMINDMIEPKILEPMLINKFRELGIEADFQYGIYDCLSDQMVYSKNLNAFQSSRQDQREVSEPEFDNDNYYFAVYFPGTSSVIVGSMGIWIFSSVILLLVIIFFAWATIIILKQRRLSEIHTDFVNNLTHEMKTPLTSMSLALERLDLSQEAEKKSISILKQELDGLKGTVTHILDSVRSDVPGTGQKKSIIDLKELAESILEVYKLDPQKKLTLKADEGLQIEVNPEEIRSVIHNLLDNAFIHGEGQVDLEIRSEGSNLIISVKDQGPGIPLEHQKRIFDKFYRVPAGNIYKGKGFGLGLFLVNELVKKNNGKLELISEEGKGAEFKILFKKK